jgi:WD repeat-containing protein 6
MKSEVRTDAFQVERSCLPVTALKCVKILESRILLAGQGPSVYLIEEQTGKRISCFRIFQSQAVHGITSLQESDSQYDSSFVLLWGGPLFQVAKLSHMKSGATTEEDHEILFVPIGPVRSAGDWILDAAFTPFEAELDRITLRAALITAHNALVHVKISLASNVHHYPFIPLTSLQVPSELKSILYSAHVTWLSQDHVLIASGTVFGEVIVWSCYFRDGAVQSVEKETTRTHYVLTGHEGSVFGVHIFQDHFMPGRSKPFRVLASCSDDRTIRVWDISDLEQAVKVSTRNEIRSGSKTRPTGFRETEEIIDNVDHHLPLAMAWGHVSRIWDVKFLASFNVKETSKLVLVSRGEDATLQLWDLVLDRKNPEATASLLHIETFSNHSGKNIWSWTTACDSHNYHVFSGGADGSVVSTNFGLNEQIAIDREQWTATDIAKLSIISANDHASLQNRVQSANDQVKQYDFISNSEFLALSQNGIVLLGTIALHLKAKEVVGPSNSKTSQDPSCIIHWEALASFEDIKSYSMISTDANVGIAIFGGVTGMIRCYYHRHRRFYDICNFTGKVTGLFLLSGTGNYSEQSILGNRNGLFSLLITLANSKVAYAVTVCSTVDGSEEKLTTEGPFDVPLFETFDITSALHLPHRFCLMVGSRTGSYGFYDTTKRDQNAIRMVMCTRNLFRKDAITSIKSLPSPVEGTVEYIQTCGRDGMFRVGFLTCQSVGELFTLPSVEPVHESSLPLGPNLEGVCINPGTSDTLVYGFRGKAFVVWNETKQQELMVVDCGGAHRTWAYSPPSSLSDSGIFLWTKASTFNVFSRTSLPSRVIQPGSHSREIKSVSISNPINIGNDTRQRLVATGAEDTTIRISSLPIHSSHLLHTRCNDFTHLRTLKKHTTGIQHLLWSYCSNYLFSSGGCSEFFVWRILHVPTYGLAVYCEAVCPIPDDGSSSPDLRITSFDILEIDSTVNDMRQGEKQFLIAMAFSNSYVKVTILIFYRKLLQDG